MDKEQSERWQRPSQWQYLLYEIYRGWRQHKQQISQARKLALLGDRDFYQTTKELLTADGHWDEEYPKFLSELKVARPAYEYMEILKQENETALLMEQVCLYPETVFKYGDVLVQTYKQEVCELCVTVIRKHVEQSSNRKEYRRLCALIESLAGFGGRSEVQTVIMELRHAYPRKLALLDELEKVSRNVFGTT